MPVTACSRAGCAGTVEDGYCNVCGLAAMPDTGPALGTGSAPSAGSGRTSSGRTSGRTRAGSTGTSRRGMLGAGLVEVPPVPYRDPVAAILANPQVPEHKRFCSNCGQPVGRGEDSRPGRADGYCRQCGTRFSFTPKLAKGDLVSGQYEVIGCIAHGGLGWIYLAHDRNVSDRWVVLKGLLDTGDADAMAAAAAERQFLATVEHPNIVKIYNFVQHPDPGTGTLVGYIVMEYVGGESLKEMMVARRRPDGSSDPLPLAQAIAYTLEVLRALGYLHGLGLLYCDFKPDNVIQSEEQLKLIDLGGVRRMDDEVSPIYGTTGYQAPEIAADGPSISSDLYTVARSLAVLTFDFKGYSGTYATSLPERAAVPLLTTFESYDRMLRRATDPDPERRFGSAAEMAEQLTGVLREVLAAGDGQPRPAMSSLFGPETVTVGADFSGGEQRPDGNDRTGAAAARAAGQSGYAPPRPRPADAAAALPVPLVDGADPGAGYLAGISAAAPAEVAALLERAPVSSTEISLRLARARIDLADFDAAAAVLDELDAAAAADGGDWRVDWCRALAELARGDPAARQMFDDLYGLLPGELAPKLALAMAAEQARDLAAAARYYELVWTTDRSYASSAFGLARVRLTAGDRAGAVAVLDSVPTSSAHYLQAQVAAIGARIRGRDGTQPEADAVITAGSRLAELGLDAERRERLGAEVLEAALRCALTGSANGNHTQARVLGFRLSERDLRAGLERTYRTLAHLANDPADRIALVDKANTVRPRTLL